MLKKKTTTEQKKKRIAKECDKLWKLACYKAWGNECIFCGKTDQTTYHHYIERSKSILLKYDPINGVPMCNMREHFVLHHSKEGDKIMKLCNEIREKRGEKWCQYIDKQRKVDNRGIFTLTWIREQREKLNKYLS